MNFVNETNEITYSKLKRLYEANKEAEKKTKERLTFWDLIYIFGKQIWYFIDNEGKDGQRFKTLDQRMKEHIKNMLHKNSYNITKTAKILNISKSKLYRLIRKYGIRHYSWKKFN